MSPCRCSAADLISVTFADGITLLRCPAHEQQHWLVDGAPADSALARARLRELFLARRSPGRPRRQVRSAVLRLDRTLAVPADEDVYPTTAGPTDAQLTALLHARGLQGSWAVA